MERTIIDLVTGERRVVEVTLEEMEHEAFVRNYEDSLRTYAEKRAAEYPPFTDYLDGIVKGDQAQIDAYISACLAVKAKYPKP